MTAEAEPPAIFSAKRRSIGVPHRDCSRKKGTGSPYRGRSRAGIILSEPSRLLQTAAELGCGLALRLSRARIAQTRRPPFGGQFRRFCLMLPCGRPGYAAHSLRVAAGACVGIFIWPVSLSLPTEDSNDLLTVWDIIELITVCIVL